MKSPFIDTCFEHYAVLILMVEIHSSERSFENLEEYTFHLEEDKTLYIYNNKKWKQ